MPSRNVPTKIILKHPDGSTQDAVLGSISNPQIAAELEKFRDPTSRFVANGPIIKKIGS